MYKYIFISLGLLLMIASCKSTQLNKGQSNTSTENRDGQGPTRSDSISYAYGVSIYNMMQSVQIKEIEMQAWKEGLLSVWGKKKPALPSVKVQEDLRQYTYQINSGTTVDINLLSQRFGQAIAYGFKMQSITPDELDVDQLYKGLDDALEGRELWIEASKVERIVKWFTAQQRDEYQAEKAQLVEKNLEKSKKFLSKNATKSGVVQTASGLQYKVLQAAEEGSTPLQVSSVMERVKIHFHGTLLNGDVFDSSKETNRPIEFKVGTVIKGWQEALMLMKKGERYKFFVPPHLGYGERGTTSVPPNAVLIYEIELLEVYPLEK